MRVECGGLRAASRNARFLLRKVFAMILGGNLFTPPLPAECGGLSSLTRRPPHSTRLLALMYVKKLIRILAVSARILTEPWRFMAESCIRKCNRVRKKQCQEIMEIHQKIGPKTQKSIKMSKNDPRAKKVAPRIGKGAKRVPLSHGSGDLQNT